MRILGRNDTPRDDVFIKNEADVKKENDLKASTSRKRKASTKILTTAKRKKEMGPLEPNPLDRTWIHPESYQDTIKLVVSLINQLLFPFFVVLFLVEI